MSVLKRVYEKFAYLVHELAKFGTVGAIAFVIDFGLTNLFRFGLDWGPLTSKVVATVFAATFAYLGNRFWTFRHREQSGLAREYMIFFVLNAVGLLISMLIIGFVSYTLDLTDPVSYNIAQMIALVLGTMFRFWSYKKWVFLPTAVPAEEIAAEAGPDSGARWTTTTQTHISPLEVPEPGKPIPITSANGHRVIRFGEPQDS
ncbi:GtrA family protein [Rhizohabitans arisaemae]|uniref:GtrA family protein n=1 Tax=Rhizohabitans arisaemae TaxID=2720610 RepID=UPI0024B06644|nr:GtrA family protein [Rhizohabitans arisaemae]